MVTYVNVLGDLLEYRWAGQYLPKKTWTVTKAPLVFLHEGLGSISLWKTFPDRLANILGRPALVFSRKGYGNSSPIDGERSFNYLHVEAQEVLPNLLEKLNIEDPIIFGHSDGASIGLIYAGQGRPLKALIAIAPHIYVEKKTLQGVRAARKKFENDDLRSKLKPYHADVDGAFWGWANIWLSASFINWNLEALLPNITAPTLLLQGGRDEYASIAQLERIEELVVRAKVRLSVIKNCYHSPHREFPDQTLRLSANFIKGSFVK